MLRMDKITAPGGNLSKTEVRLSRIRNYISKPHILMSIFLILILTVLVIIPVIKMFVTTFVWQMEDIRLAGNAEPGKFTLFHWHRVFASVLSKPLLWEPLKNSMLLGAGVSFFAIITGALLAWLVARTAIPFRTLIAAAAVVPYIIPSYIHATNRLNLL